MAAFTPPFCVPACAALILAVLGLPAGPAAAQEQAGPKLELVQAYTYNASAGWHVPCYEFHQPVPAGPSVFISLITSGYRGLRDVELRVTAAAPTGEEVVRRVERQRLPAGEFEYIIEDLGLLADPFASGLYELVLSAELSGSPVQAQRCDVTVVGLALPNVTFSNLRITNPARKQNIAKFFPGDEFLLEGEVAVDSSPTASRPVLYVDGELTHERAMLDLASPPAVTALNWGRVTLDAPAGVWQFAVRGRLPVNYPDSPDGLQPFSLVVALRWSAGAVVRAEVTGEVLDPGLGFNSSRVQVERLIQLQPARAWEVRPGPSLPALH